MLGDMRCCRQQCTTHGALRAQTPPTAYTLDRRTSRTEDTRKTAAPPPRTNGKAGRGDKRTRKMIIRTQEEAPASEYYTGRGSLGLGIINHPGTEPQAPTCEHP